MPKCHSNLISFKVPLSFDQELRPSANPVCPVTTLSDTGVPNPGVSGVAKITFAPDFSSVHVKICVFNALVGNARITAAHLHLAPANRNGDIVLPLFDSGVPGGIPVNGVLVDATFTAGDIDCATFEGYFVNSIASLYEAILRGLIYVNVHGSGPYAGGIIRGQIFPQIHQINKH